MKIRLCVLAFVALLLARTWAKAETPAPSANPAAPVVTSEIPGAAPFCAASVANLDKSLDLVPSPVQKSITCGSCSYSSCVGMAPNAGCYYLAGGVYHLAKCVINSVCSDNSRQCDCTNNPPI